ncbi:histone-like nucleoid-structuring protein Lsr2 [Amycolatopsis sp. CA-230715]|uniref:histone-like nucleoid-structuring protein Lsr2 n=1 Tax=Amycolatopsis sp. CA-230715 TaxID=2745196 RepID=UPI001C020D5D|nr:Lsr2 family protein [Amycolatopsis sp. CA-230715]QWF78616.1 Nucleoid-associated protein Lsr2 [Amycolatopsis sp. CA-230715]
MAQKISVQMLDDIDGSEATQTVPFALDGVSYEIDLSDDNAARLRDELAVYVGAGQRVGGRKIRLATGQSAAEGSSTTTTADRERNRQIRVWAQENGYEVAERGRLSGEIVSAYEAAQQAPVEKAAEKPARKRAPRRKKAASVA